MKSGLYLKPLDKRGPGARMTRTHREVCQESKLLNLEAPISPQGSFSCHGLGTDGLAGGLSSCFTCLRAAFRGSAQMTLMQTKGITGTYR